MDDGHFNSRGYVYSHQDFCRINHQTLRLLSGYAALTRPCMIKINKLLKDQVSFNRLLGGRPDLRTGY